MEDLLVIKIGGNIIDNEKALHAFLDDFASINGNKILVHGGGKLATELSTELGIETKIVNGRRVTDEQTLRVITMVYAGWINKSITAYLQAKSCNAIGLSGVDANLLPAVKRPVVNIDYGLVGDISNHSVNTMFLNTILGAGNTPVIAPVTANAQGQLLNVNADTIASTLAGALSSLYNTTLVYCFEKNGLLNNINDEGSVIASINKAEIEQLKQQGIIAKGMIPKIDNATNALMNGVNNVIIGHAAQINQLVKKEAGYGTHLTT